MPINGLVKASHLNAVCKPGPYASRRPSCRIADENWQNPRFECCELVTSLLFEAVMNEGHALYSTSKTRNNMNQNESRRENVDPPLIHDVTSTDDFEVVYSSPRATPTRFCLAGEKETRCEASVLRVYTFFWSFR